MFLIGGPAYCGTTLLTLMLNQDGVTCLNEPDFHNPAQSHNGLPVLQKLFPGKDFPERTEHALSYVEAFALMQRCELIIEPNHLGFKFCNRPFVEFARLFRSAGLPVVAIIRDVRDALVRPLLPYINGEAGLVREYRYVWEHRSLYSAVIRYEDLVHQSAATMAAVSATLGVPLGDRSRWNPDEVSESMLYPQDRHGALKAGSIVTDRTGIWRDCGKLFSAETHELARDMGYSET